MSSNVTTRSVTEDLLFGQHLESLPEDQLPLKIEIVRHILFRRNNEFDKSYVRKGKTVKELSAAKKTSIVKETAQKLIYIWSERANIPVKSERSIEQNIESLMDSAARFRNKDSSRIPKKDSEKWKEAFYKQKGLDRILDIGLCQCFANSNNPEQILLPCKCGQFPKNELDFYREQKFIRRGKILRQIDPKGTQELLKAQAKEARKQYEAELLEKQKERQAPDFDVNPNLIGATSLDYFDDETDLPHISENSDDSDYTSNLDPKPKVRNRTDYSLFVSYAHRKGITNRETLASLINCLKICEGVEDVSSFVSATKMSNEWKKISEDLIGKHSQVKEVICIKGDGKKGPAKLAKLKTGVKDLYTCIAEPGGAYLHNFEPEKGNAYQIARGFLEVVYQYDSEETLLAIGGDNCPTNTGHKGGAFRWLEVFLGKELSWICCLLHYIELPLGKLITLHAGPTKGPDSRSGVLGEALTNLKQKPMVKFKPISGKVPEDIDSELLTNQDQKYFYLLAIGIQKGYKYLLDLIGEMPNLPSKQHNARWLNDAAAIEYEYITTEDPSPSLIRLVTIVLNWYGPLFFAIKKEPNVSMGAIHFYNSIALSREFTTVEKVEVDECIKRNSFFAHPEFILISGLCHGTPEERMKCAKMIIAARSKPKLKNRKFKAPGICGKLNLNANSFMEMVDLTSIRNKSYVTDPPLLRLYDNDALIEFAKNGNLILPNIPCHSVNNERCVKDTSLASSLSVGEDGRHSFILNLGENRAKIPHHPKKSDFTK